MIRVGVIDSSVRIRDAKEILAMKNVYGDEVQYIFMKTLNIPGNESKLNKLRVHWINPAKPPMQDVILQLCKKYKIDLLHTHNYPDNYGNWGLNIREKLGIPVVHECHDIGYANVKPAQAQITEQVMKGVDKIITVSDGMTNYLHNKYNVKNKCTVLRSYPNCSLVPEKVRSMSPTGTRGIYQGGINFSNNPTGKYNHRYYKDIFIKLVNQGITIDVYPAHDSGSNNYKDKRIPFRPTVHDVGKLYRILSQFDFGFVGYKQTKSIVMDIAMPNKLFEYIACGIPIVAMNYNLISKFVKRNEFGIVVDKNTLKLPSNYKDILKKAKKNVVSRRHEFLMESQIHKLMKVYKSVL